MKKKERRGRRSSRRRREKMEKTKEKERGIGVEGKAFFRSFFSYMRVLLLFFISIISFSLIRFLSLLPFSLSLSLFLLLPLLFIAGYSEAQAGSRRKGDTAGRQSCAVHASGKQGKEQTERYRVRERVCVCVCVCVLISYA